MFFYGGMARLLFGLVLVVLLVRMSKAGFGDDISQDNEDNRFANMGQVTKDSFDVESGVVTLQLNVQDTEGIKEIWILDFQPYRFNIDAMPVNELDGQLMMDQTSECSSVYETASWNDYFNDTYFTDKDSTGLASKKLFTQFTRGSLNGDGFRDNKITFTGDMGLFFTCKDSINEDFIWQMTDITDDEIEYRTKLYTTNVRPKDPLVSTGGISFVQSHIELIWRLSRSVLTKFLISSTALIRPILEFARVTAVYDALDRAVPTQSALHIRFRTVVDSDTQMLSYNTDSLVYDPDNTNHGINAIDYQPDGTLDAAPDCEFKLDEGTQTQLQCQQTWEFKLVLDVDTSGQVDNRIPVDASGTFEFYFTLYGCEKTNNEFDKATCQQVGTDPAKISALITIQTTVFIQDMEDDQVTIILQSLTGAENEDLSYGTGSRGVAHKEIVDLKVKFSPALLRKDYDLDLLLFMVCKGEEYASDTYAQGCLEAPSSDRYVAHRDGSFSFIPRVSNENGTTLLDEYNSSHVAEDTYQPLESQEYLREDESGQALAVPVHQSKFVNVALSGESAVYTITTVYRLVERLQVPLRKRRATLPKMHDVILSKSVWGRTRTGKSTGTIIERHSRDVEDSARDTHGHAVPFTTMGCPEDSEHIQEELDCRCPVGKEYSLKTFECLEPGAEVDVEEETNEVQEETNDDEDDLKKPGSKTGMAPATSCTLWLIVTANAIIVLMRMH
ncbi:uncharacterized protein [Asterias amurensis]|uniref:uncharacterized protein n=1 Tax=Asterias amurensis TaxID=7602 RepID=UPI003AB1B12E